MVEELFQQHHYLMARHNEGCLLRKQYSDQLICIQIFGMTDMSHWNICGVCFCPCVCTCQGVSVDLLGDVPVRVWWWLSSSQLHNYVCVCVCVNRTDIKIVVLFSLRHPIAERWLHCSGEFSCTLIFSATLQGKTCKSVKGILLPLQIQAPGQSGHFISLVVPLV